MNIVRLFACLLVFFGFSPCGRAHQVASVELEFQKLDDQWRLSGEMDIAYMLPETRNIPGGLPLSREAVMKSSPAEFARIRKETEATLRKLIRITFGDKDVPWRVEFPDFTKEPFELPEEAGDIALLSTQLRIDPLPGSGDLRIHWAGEQETELIILIEEGDDSQIISTLPGGSLMLLKQTAAGKSAPVVPPLTGGWLQLGFSHVLGLDHILFILGLFLLVPKWKPLLQQSLLFTVAHSITLALAIFGVVQMPPLVLQVLIALSIAWVGVENLLTRELGRSRLILVFGFGLLHGLGFAGTLAEKLDGVPRDQLIWPLFGFNVGVELAQISVLVGAFLLLWPIRKWTPQVRTVGSAVIALAGVIWVVQCLFFA
ncbi:HupE/UreJ family protein [bacterium]|nr:HupE/UreJ family protein [bacterium]